METLQRKMPYYCIHSAKNIKNAIFSRSAWIWTGFFCVFCEYSHIQNCILNPNNPKLAVDLYNKLLVRLSTVPLNELENREEFFCSKIFCSLLIFNKFF